MILLTILIIIALVSGLLYWIFMSPYSQVFGKFIWRAKTNQKLIALTFDDGPNEPYTSELLDLLKEKNIKATFFIVGQNALKNPDIVKRMYKEGHTIGNHSLNHKFSKYITEPNFAKEIIESQKILKEIVGKEPALQRTPWLFRSPIIFKTLKNNNLTPISGEFCHPLEVFGASAEAIAKNAIKKAKPGSIIIFHDGNGAIGGDRSRSINASKIFVEKLLENDYQFVTVDKLLDIKAYK
jgi:peptidoglycan/xylan/chitin deacetylase (PgdA/CDA1 family)